MDLRQFYEIRIAECAAEAARADLPKVRDRALRAQQAWQTMLDRVVDHGSGSRRDP